MRKTLYCVSFITAVTLLVGSAKAQTNYVFTSFQCTPSSCIEETPIPVVQGGVAVSFTSTCSGGIVSGISGQASAVIGINGECPVPYTPHAEVDKSTTTELDDCGDPYNVDSETEIAEIKSVLGTIVWLDEAGASCDGGTFGPTNNGTKPC